MADIVYKQLLAKWHLDEGTEYRFRLVHGTTERFTPHWHDFYEIFLMTRGEVWHEINGKSEKLRPGALLFVRPQDRHYYRPVDETLEFANLAFSAETVETLFAYLGKGFDGERLTASPMPPTVLLTENETKRLYLRLAELGTVPAEEKEKRKSTMRALLAWLFPTYFDLLPPENRAIPYWLERAYRKMREPRNFIEGKERFFELCGKSREHATRLLKTYYGVTPSAYVNHLRLSYAASLFSGSNLNVTEICYECGFQNVSWFYTAFRAQFGMTPLAYRQRAVASKPRA